MELDENRLQKIAKEVETEWQMCGLSGGIYEDYAREILKRYLTPPTPVVEKE